MSNLLSIICNSEKPETACKTMKCEWDGYTCYETPTLGNTLYPLEEYR